MGGGALVHVCHRVARLTGGTRAVFHVSSCDFRSLSVDFRPRLCPIC
jgi:hypothetical protein